MLSPTAWITDAWAILSSSWEVSFMLGRASYLILEGYLHDCASGSLTVSRDRSPARARAAWFSGLYHLVQKTVDAPAANRAAGVLPAPSRLQSGDAVPRTLRRVSFDFPEDVEVLPERRSRFTLPSPPENRMRRSVRIEMASVGSDSGISDCTEAGLPAVHAEGPLGRATVMCAMNGVAILQRPPPVIQARITSQGGAEDDSDDIVVLTVAVKYYLSLWWLMDPLLGGSISCQLALGD
jgi:hypothetical protein